MLSDYLYSCENYGNDPCLSDDDCRDMMQHLHTQIGSMYCCHCAENTTPIDIDEKGRCRIAKEIG